MTLPTDKNVPLGDPGEMAFTSVKHHFTYIDQKAKETKDLIVRTIIDDMILDHALSSALDEVGKVLELQAQNEGIETPLLDGSAILKDANRIGRLVFAVRFCEALGLSDEDTSAIRQAEISRLWGEHIPKEKRDLQPTISLPAELTGILRSIERAMSKKGNHAQPGRNTGSSEPSSGRANKGKPVHK